jgi:hypothetical protein
MNDASLSFVPQDEASSRFVKVGGATLRHAKNIR